MKLLFKQKNKDFFSAEFDILENDNIIGKIFLKGKMSSIKVSLNGQVYGNEFTLKYANKILSGTNKRFFPYNILKDNNIVGEIFHTEFKKNIFSKYEYTKCIYNRKEYNLYSMVLGTKGISVLYHDDIQLAQIEKDRTVYNDLHNFNIYSVDRESAFISILMSCYKYITIYYEPGIKIIKSIKKSYSKTFNKDLLERYNPDWIKKLKE